MEDTIQEIVKKLLNIDTLETRNSDSLDFHEVSVWALKETLEECYLKGRESITNPNKGLCDD